MDYSEYKHDFLELLRNDSAINGFDTEDEFIERTFNLLSDYDEVEDPVRVGMGDKRGKGGRIMRFDGYSFDEADRSLILFISDFQDSYTPDNLNMTRVDELYWRLYYFLDEVCNGKINDYFDDSDDILKISKMIRNRVNAVGDDPDMVLKIRFVIVTNKELDSKLMSSNLLETTIRKSKGKAKKTKSTKKIKKADFNEKPLEITLWHLERFYQMEESNSNDPIVIDIHSDFPELGYKGIPCIKGNIGENLGYEAYIAIIPGDLLAHIYIEHGSKVLEGNVRAFLGAGNSRKSVNYGIRKTINTDPTKFFTYNNGIATTAADVELETIGGETFITKLVDLQIINGGQTTASLAEAVLKKTNVNLEGIYVPMKLTVIEDRETENEDGIPFYEEMVQNIAKFANKQNNITDADLFSNDPFHRRMEQLSKKHLAPPAIYPIPTGWYYERSRKRYQQEQIKLRGDELKRFIAKFPKKQVINKEQLAMYITTLNCKPDIVCKGKSKVIGAFATDITEEYRSNREQFNELYFHKCVCAAIIFRTVDTYLETNKDSARHPTGFWYKTGGYKLDIVPYTIAKIISSIPKGYTLNWDMIWKKQTLSPAFMREIEKVTKLTNDFICDSHGVIVTEYCKKATTWNAYRDNVPYELSAEFIDELLPESLVKEAETAAKTEQKEVNDLSFAMDAVALGIDFWNNILSIGLSKALVNRQEQLAVKDVIVMAQTGNIPVTGTGKIPRKVMTNLRLALAVKEKLEAEGLLR